MVSVQWIRISIVLILFGTVTAQTAAAQDFEIRGPAGLDVFFVTEKGRTPLVTVGSDGRGIISVKPIGPGKDLEVLIETCDGRMVAVLIERGRNDEACEDAPPFSGRCKCVRPGVFLTTGRLERLTITASGQVAIEGTPPRSTPGWGVGWLVSGDAGSASLSNASKTCNTARSELQAMGLPAACDADSTVGAWGADLGVTFLRFVQIRTGYLDIGRVSVIGSAAAPPTSAVLNAQFGRTQGVMFTGGLRFPIGPVVPFADAGIWRWSAESSTTIEISGPAPFSARFSEDNSGWDPVYAFGMDFWPIRNFGLTAGARFVRVTANELPGVDDAPVSEMFRMWFVGLKFRLN